MHFKLFTISKMKNKYNRSYLKMILILSGNIKLNPGPTDRNQNKKIQRILFNIWSEPIDRLSNQNN